MISQWMQVILGEASPAAAQVEILVQQIEFLQDANDRLASSFESFTNTVNLTFGIFMAIMGLFAGIGVFLFGRSLKEAREEVKKITDREMERVVGEAIAKELPQVEQTIRQQLAEQTQSEIDNIQQMIDLEAVVKDTKIVYILPSQSRTPKPPECRMLKERKFKDVEFLNEADWPDFRGKIVVMDLINYGGDDAEGEIHRAIAGCEPLKEEVILVFYTGFSERYRALQTSKELFYFNSANNRISLMGALVDAAYVLQTLTGRE